MIRGVFFDFYGTIAGWEPAGEMVQAQAATTEGVVVGQEALSRAYPLANAYLDAENAQRPIAQRSSAERDDVLTEYERRLMTAAGVEISVGVARRIWKRVNDAPKELAGYPEARGVLEEVRAAGLIIGIISNMGRDLPEIVDRAGLGGLADVVISSAEVGVSKPHAPIFAAALGRAGLQASEAVHVGDSYDGDVLGALGAGMHAILLTRSMGAEAGAQREPPPGAGAVRSLSEVLPYLRREGLIG